MAQEATAPKLLNHVPPEFTEEARTYRVQGSVVLGITIGTDGVAHTVNVVSPLGFGLDQTAMDAVKRWRFSPATRDGKAVEHHATVEVNFRLLDGGSGNMAEMRRQEYNKAVAGLGSGDAKQLDAGVKKIRQLARAGYPPAMFTDGAWKMEGKHGVADIPAGLKQIEKAASKKHGPALGLLGLWKYEGRFVTKDTKDGLRLMNEGAIFGSLVAQRFLGERSAAGTEIPKDIEHAKRMFRLCAARGDATCQFRLAGLILESAPLDEREKIEAVAWLKVAAANHSSDAAEVLKNMDASLTLAQKLKAEALQKQLTPAR